MAKAVVAAVRDAGLTDGIVVARNESAGTALADKYGFTWQADLGSAKPHVLVNATPVGMAGGPESMDLSFPVDAIDAAAVVFYVVAKPPETPLVLAATQRSKTVITGAEVIALQAAEQFALYTGVRPTVDQVRRASVYSRAE